MKLKVNVTFQPTPENGEQIDYQLLVDWAELLFEELEMKDVYEKEKKRKEISKKIQSKKN